MNPSLCSSPRLSHSQKPMASSSWCCCCASQMKSLLSLWDSDGRTRIYLRRKTSVLLFWWLEFRPKVVVPHFLTPIIKASGNLCRLLVDLCPWAPKIEFLCSSWCPDITWRIKTTVTFNIINQASLTSMLNQSFTDNFSCMYRCKHKPSRFHSHYWPIFLQINFQQRFTTKIGFPLEILK